MQNYPKEWGGPPLKSIEVVVVLNFLCWFMKACIPHHPMERDGDLLPFEMVVVVIYIFLHLFKKSSTPHHPRSRRATFSPQSRWLVFPFILLV